MVILSFEGLGMIVMPFPVLISSTVCQAMQLQPPPGCCNRGHYHEFRLFRLELTGNRICFVHRSWIRRRCSQFVNFRLIPELNFPNLKYRLNINFRSPNSLLQLLSRRRLNLGSPARPNSSGHHCHLIQRPSPHGGQAFQPGQTGQGIVVINI